MTEPSASEIRVKIGNLVEDYFQKSKIEEPFKPGVTPIPPSGKILGVEEYKLMVEASLDGWLTTGRFNKKFEEDLSKFLNVKYLLTVNSGSSANLVAFNTLTSSKLGKRAIMPGDEVISVAAGFPTTVNPIIQYGAIPVFIDVDLNTLNIDIDALEEAISPKTKAIMLAHTLGNPFNLERIKNICKKFDLWLIEDCCDALGAKYNNQMVGTFGDIGTLSFYPAHHITMGEGGAVFTNSHKLKIIAESFRDWGRDCFCPPGVDNSCRKRFEWKLGNLPQGYDHKYIYSHLGYNLKITDMQAACGLGQLSSIEQFIKKRKKNYEFISNNLIEFEDILHIQNATENSDPSWFGFAITLAKNSKIKRKNLINYLDMHKIGTRLLFGGNLIYQPYMQNRNYKVIGNLNNTNMIMNNTFWIGLHPALTEEMLKFSIETIKNYISTEIN